MKYQKFLLIFGLALTFFCIVPTYAQVSSWNWARSGTGNGSVEGSTVTSDPFGNIYVSGYYSSDNMTIGSVTLQNLGLSFNDGFLAKYDPSGNFLWAERFGGSGNDRGTSIATDKAGNVYLTGYFYSPKIGFGKDTLINAGNVGDIFIVKYDSSGKILWAKREGAAALEIPHAIHVDGNNNVIVAGRFSSNSITFGTTTLALAGSMDVFIAKYNVSGNLLWAKGAGGGSNDEAYSISSDPSGNIYLAGYFTQPSNFGTIKLTSAGISDMFLAKYDPSGNVLWAKNAGGKGDDRATGLQTDASGNSYIAGYFTNDAISFGSIMVPNKPGDNSFLAKYDTNGNVLWANGMGGDSQALDLAVFNDNVYACGSFQADTLTYGTTNLIINGNSDFFLLNCDTNGKPKWAIKQTSDGESGEIARSVATDPSGNVIVTGLFGSEPITFGNSGISSVRGFNMFVAKLGSTPTGIADLQNSSDLIVYPNPGTGHFILKSERRIKTIEVYTVSGSKIYTHNPTKERGSVEIDISSFPSGVYIVSLFDGKKRYSEKMVKSEN